MSSGIKNSLVFGGLLLALIAGVYFSGWLTITFLGVGAHVNGLTYWSYVRALDLPAVQPYVGKIKLAGFIGFGLPLLAWTVSLIPLFKSKAQALHGDARLADMRDLKKAGLLKQTQQSILIGKYKGSYLWLGGAQHTIVISPTRSGKTTSIAIPVLLTYVHSIVVLDLKGELRKVTSGWREAQGHTIYVWAPYDEQGRTHRFNPFTLLASSDAAKRIGDIQTIAAILYPDEQGKDPFWTTQSRAAFTAFASFMFERWENEWARWKGLSSSSQMFPRPNDSDIYPSFERILRISSGMGSQSTKELLQEILKEPKYGYVSPQTRTVFGNLAGLAEQTFSSVIASMQAPLQQFLNPILANATNATDFDITTLRKRPSTLYVDIPTNKLDESGKLLNIFFSTVIGNNLTQQLGETPDLKYQMLMLMDEFTAMGRVDVWAKRISISASYGVRDLCIVQSRSQLRATYGDNDAQNFITNHGAQIVFAPREQGDANEYSEAMGYTTIRKKNRSQSSGRGSKQVSISYSEERRALYLPQEIKELPQDDELIFYEGCRPIRAKKNWFFKDRALKQRASMPPAVIKVAKQVPVHARAAGIREVIRPQDEQAARWLRQ
jgi:type IV secretion system protein VirD4